MKKTPALAAPALLTIALFWGAAFVIMKPAIDKEPINDFLAKVKSSGELASIIKKNVNPHT